jgi:hypothetical protein
MSLSAERVSSHVTFVGSCDRARQNDLRIVARGFLPGVPGTPVAVGCSVFGGFRRGLCQAQSHAERRQHFVAGDIYHRR